MSAAMSTTTTRRLFICHAPSEIEATSEVVDALEHALDFPARAIWASNLPGYSFETDDGDALRIALSETSVALVLISASSARDPQFNFELGATWGVGIRTVLLRLGGSDWEYLPTSLRGVRSVQAHDSREWSALIGDLALWLGLVARRPSLPSAPAIAPATDAQPLTSVASEGSFEDDAETRETYPRGKLDPLDVSEITGLSATLAATATLPSTNGLARPDRRTAALLAEPAALYDSELEDEAADPDFASEVSDLDFASELPEADFTSDAPDTSFATFASQLADPHFASEATRSDDTAAEDYFDDDLLSPDLSGPSELDGEPARAAGAGETETETDARFTSSVFARLPTCEIALEAGRTVSDCLFNRVEIDDFAQELTPSLGRLLNGLGEKWDELRGSQDLDGWVAHTDQLLQWLPAESRRLENWYRLGFELAILHNLAGQLALDGSEPGAEQRWRGALERFLMRAERAEIGYENLGSVLGLLENLAGPKQERDLANIGRSLEALRRHAAGADRIHTAA